MSDEKELPDKKGEEGGEEADGGDDDGGAGRAENRINVSGQKQKFFYVDLAKRFLANPDKPDELELTGLGSCMPMVIACADVLRERGLVEVSKLETGLAGRGKRAAKISAWVKKSDQFDKVMAEQQAERDAKLAAQVAKEKNSAFVFIKPHAVTDKVKELVKEGLTAKGLKINKEGEIKAERIDKKKLVDNHYYSIASKATILKPKDLNVPADKFKEKFGLEWQEALDKELCYNAMDACKKLELDADELDKIWGQTKKAGDMIKFGGGFYCGHVKVDGKDPIYVFNGFFMSMRTKYTKPGTSIYWYTVEWDPAELSWADFRGKVLGPTDPNEAPADSLRGQILKDWEGLGLKEVPNVGDNGVHASASPFEALAERMNWLDKNPTMDQLGRTLKSSGVGPRTVREWGRDPQVNVGDKKGSLFDALEDLDAPACINKCAELWKINRPEKPAKEE